MSAPGNMRPLAGHIGAEITGIDLRDLTGDEVRTSRSAWLGHKVLFFPRQGLTNW